MTLPQVVDSICMRWALHRTRSLMDLFSTVQFFQVQKGGLQAYEMDPHTTMPVIYTSGDSSPPLFAIKNRITYHNLIRDRRFHTKLLL